MNRTSISNIILFSIALALTGQVVAAPADIEISDEFDDIQIVEGEDKIVYEYRQNGVLMMIKVVPDKGKPYYMVPADGSAHFESLDLKKSLFPQWVIIEW